MHIEVAYGKPHINPDLVERFEHNLALAEADQDTFYWEQRIYRLSKRF
jgi:hypothetical protein